jgi:predicted transposase/invertase (TIGR01784 family)
MEEKRIRDQGKSQNELPEKELKHFRLIDDSVARMVFMSHKECVTEVLRILLQDPSLELASVSVQEALTFPAGRGICMDVFAVDSRKPNLYNVELQRVANGSIFQRAYYYNAAAHIAYMPKGTDWKDLPVVTTIFILENGLPGLHRACDSYVWMNEDLKIPGMNSPRIMFFNTEIQGEDEVGRLMADFVNTDPLTMNSPTLAKGVIDARGGLKGKLKEMNKGGDETMRTGLKEIDDQMDIEREEGKEEAARTIAARLLKSGEFSSDKVAEFSGLAIEEVKAIQEEMAKQA